ncbi:hypothetical protein VSH64_40645 [Amycolatopsis rhabdoformis]|uniref:DUF4253 domain-containing protein n=1 Tax=Amycolatopsis rhabdoformis TaxID=1448059 RepID=A0ABZ1I4D9_9PSEU|nr:hypothetical protein [Amycolatopsis rhabdoformis]WSE29064.1 hypothetical protein VSH64_40645 [Amycolatopsis rhabdoformis]
MESWELHSMARRYLMARYTELSERYAELPDQGRDGYSVEAQRTYPRYNVVAAMLTEVERLDPDDLPPVQPLAAALMHAAETARSVFTDPPTGPIEAEAMSAERQRFARAVTAWVADADVTVEPLGYRRVLRPEEASGWRSRLASRWDVELSDVSSLSWHPLSAGPVPDEVLVLREDSTWDGPGVTLVRQALHHLGRRRVVELREHGPEYLLDVDLLEPHYTGAEGLWTDETLDWLAYASHEGTLAFGGTLAAELRGSWPRLEEWRWSGW